MSLPRRRPVLEPEDGRMLPASRLSRGLEPQGAEVQKLVAKDLTNTQIAQELFISPRTVDRQQSRYS